MEDLIVGDFQNTFRHSPTFPKITKIPLDNVVLFFIDVILYGGSNSSSFTLDA